MFRDKSSNGGGHNRNITDSESLLKTVNQSLYSVKNVLVSKMQSQHDGDERLSSEEVGGVDLRTTLGNNSDILSKDIAVPSQVDLLYQDALQRQLRKKRTQAFYQHEECTF